MNLNTFDDLGKYIFEGLETYKDLFDNAHDLVHIAEPGGKLMYINNAWTKLLGYSLEEVVEQSIYFFIDPGDRDRFKEYRERILGGVEENKEIIVGCITKAGGKVWIEGFVSAKIVDSRPLYSRGIFRDVTLRLHNEAALLAMNTELQQREANLQGLLFHAPDPVIVINAESIVTYWNPKAETVFGWTSEEVLGESLTNIIIPQQHRAAHEAGMRRYLSTGEARVLNKTIEITALRKGGNEFYVSLTISTTLQRGEVAFIAFIRDIDEQKRNILELEEKKLQLEISNEELERFAHVASHDMKEPIRKIRIYIDQLRSQLDESSSAESKNYIARIEKAALRLTEMVDGVLAYSSVKSEPFFGESVDLNGVIKSIESDLELLLEQKGAILKYTELPVIEGARFLLYQLFYNLINNSLKFSRPAVNPEIELTARTVAGIDLEQYSISGDKPFIEIAIKDNGIGFSEKNAERIFKTFTRLHSKDKFEGTGIGLSLCKSIVEKHNGLIKAYGEEGAGATFIVLLPRKH